MGILANLLEFRRQEQEKNMADINAIAPAIQSFMQNRRQSILENFTMDRQTRMDELTTRKTEAEINNLLSEQANKTKENDIISQVLGGNGGGANGAYIDTIKVGDATVKIPPSADRQAAEIAQNDAKIISEKKAKGIDEAQAGRFGNIAEALNNKDELYEILFPKKEDGTYDTSKFNPEIKTPQMFKQGSAKYQRMVDIMKSIDIANKLTMTTRGVNGETVSASPGSTIKGLNVFTNPSAFATNLDEFFAKAEQTAKDINPNYAGSGKSVDGASGGIPTVGGMLNGEKIKSVKRIK